LIVQCGVSATLLNDDQTTTDTPYFGMSAVADDGAVSGTTISYPIDQTNVYDHKTVHWAGDMTGAISDDYARVDSLRVTYTMTTTDSEGEWFSTENYSYVVRNIPLTYKSTNGIWYEVKGTDTCAHLFAVSHRATWEGGGRRLTGRGCNDESSIWLQFVRMPP
jgi:hypothetical protein